jgi:hypothetical protein
MRSKPKLRLVPENLTQEEADYRAVAVEDDEVGLQSPAAPTLARRKDGGFPFYMLAKEWAKKLRAGNASGDLWSLSLVLQDRTHRHDRFAVTAKVMQEADVARQHKVNLLKRLVELDLVEVEWRGSKSPMVTPFYPPGGRRRRPDVTSS